MIDLMDLGRISINARLLVDLHGIVFPALFQQFVNNLHKLIRHPISLIMLYLLVETKRICSTLEIGSHDIPSNSAVGNLVQRAVLPSQRVWVLVSRTGSDSKTKIFRIICHCRDQETNIQNWNLSCTRKCWSIVALVNVVDAQYIGKELNPFMLMDN